MTQVLTDRVVPVVRALVTMVDNRARFRPKPGWWRPVSGADGGSASVEFVLFGIVLLIPLAYLLVTVFSVQSAAYGVGAASREAGRVFVQAPASGDAAELAYLAAKVSLHDYGIELSPDQVVISCSATPCLTPGAYVDVRIDLEVALPLLPNVFGEAPASIAVHGEHAEIVDRFRPAG